MEDLVASVMSSFSHRHSAPLYLLYNDVSTLPKHIAGHGGGGGGGFEFATRTGSKLQGVDGDAGVRACSSDVSAACADELFQEGALLPLKLPPRLQRPSLSAAASAATSPTAISAKANSSRSPFASSRRHGGFDPFAAALEKVRRDVDAAPMRRSRSLSPLRGPTAAAAAHHKGNSRPRYAAPARAVAARPAWRRGRGVKHLLCGAVMATRPHRRGGGSAPYRRGLLVCFGF
ncbi:hypothetical protein GUJ93_ZPchr0008g13623 [Zizania palustris]|uniref:Uncharacterized protein n=1 Tax=Zizania palustris TaxID=103762 RepID=A0A8J5QWQ7_ZIZPA|nr:hypothetical protein GUJ93_ZPchr0008g13623 [Zizania palustris]